jgi:spermidine synthase
MALGNEWFTEICDEHGSAFSMKIKEKLHEEQSPFQKIAIYDTTHFGKLMIIDGFTMVSTQDNFLYHEMMSHPVLYTHAAPRRVLIIGGGDCGTLKQVLKHPEVEQAQQVDIDERVTRLAEVYFPELCESNDDPRAELYFDDGIKWVKDAEAGYYDVIIVDSTDPIGPAEGLFNEAFYRSCRRALGENGILVQQSESPLYHAKLIKEMREAMQNAGFEQFRTYDFPQPIYPSGWWSGTMAARQGVLDHFREADSQNKPFKTLFYNSARHRASMVEIPLLGE